MKRRILPPWIRYGALLVGILLALAVNSCGKRLCPVTPQERDEAVRLVMWLVG